MSSNAQGVYPGRVGSWAASPALTPAPTLTNVVLTNGIGRRQLLSDIPSLGPSSDASSGDPSGAAPSDGAPSSQPPSSGPGSSVPPSSQPPSSSPSSPPSSVNSDSGSSSDASSLPSSVAPSSASEVSSSPASSTPSDISTPSQSSTSADPSSTPSLPPSTSLSASVTVTAPPDALSTASSSSAQTTITTTFVTNIDGVETTITSAIPTTINSAPNSSSGSQKRSIIAGSVIGGVALLAIIISLVIFCKRQNYRKLRVFGRQPRSRSMLLEGEDFDDTDPPMMRYRDYPTGPTTSSQGTYSGVRDSLYTDDHSVPYPSTPPSASRGPPGNTSPRLMGFRASESGSIFREDVWPPPGDRFVDPILASSSQVNLGRVVDDVMGPGGSRPDSTQSISYHLRGGSDPFRTPPPPPAYSHHSRDESRSPLIEGSPPDEGVQQTLFVTNPRTPSPISPTFPRNWLDRTPHTPPQSSQHLPQRRPTRQDTMTSEDGGQTAPMGEAL